KRPTYLPNFPGWMQAKVTGGPLATLLAMYTMHSPCSAQTGSCMGVIGRYHSSEVDTEKSGVKLRRPPHNWDRKRARGFLEAPRSRHIALHCRAKMPARSASNQNNWHVLTPRRDESLDLVAPIWSTSWQPPPQ